MSQQNEPSRAAMEAARNLFTDFGLAGRGKSTQFSATCAYYAAHIDAAMKPERDAAEKMAAIVEHVATDGAEITPQLVAAASKALAAYEAAKGK